MSVSTTSRGRHPPREQAREIAGAARHVQNPVARSHPAALHGQPFPQPVQAARHQVIHEIVARCHGIENAGYTPGLLVLRYFSKPKCVVFLTLAPEGNERSHFGCGRLSKLPPTGRACALGAPCGATGVSARSGFTQPLEIPLPERFLVASDLVQVVPGIQPRVVTVAEHELDRVSAHRLDGRDLHVASCLAAAPPARPMAAHLRRG